MLESMKSIWLERHLITRVHYKEPNKRVCLCSSHFAASIPLDVGTSVLEQKRLAAEERVEY